MITRVPRRHTVAPARKRIGRLGLLTACTLLLLSTACASSPEAESGGDGEPRSLPDSLRSFLASGAYEHEVVTRSFDSAHGCTVTYDHYLPVSDMKHSSTTVILGHGFLRDREQNRRWAAHWASHGVPVANVSFCNSRWFNGFHGRNADDLVELSRTLVAETRTGSIMYAGHSAGGLSALLATLRDPHARAYLGLDTVDTGARMAEAQRALTVPALFLLGEPAACNANGNIVEAIPANLVSESGSMTMLRVHGATHCHFEWPSTPGCRLLCGSAPSEAAAERIQQVIRGLGTGWVLSAAGSRSTIPLPASKARSILDSLITRDSISILEHRHSRDSRQR